MSSSDLMETSGANHPHDDDTVGYGRPPKQYQFKPGTSGNPMGRPRGRKSLSVAEALHQDMARMVTVTEKGRIKKMSMAEVIARGLSKRAATDTATAKFVVALAAEGAAEAAGKPNTNAETSAILRELDLETLWKLREITVEYESKKKNLK